MTHRTFRSDRGRVVEGPLDKRGGRGAGGRPVARSGGATLDSDLGSSPACTGASLLEGV